MSIAKYSVTAIECPDPIALASLYSKLSGFEMEPLGNLAPEEVSWICLLRDGEGVMCFQKISN